MRRYSTEPGFSLIEMMVALTIGLLLLVGMTTLFVNSSNNQRELQRNAQQIENGRYAQDMLSQDLHVAGFYGVFSNYSTPTALPDPCDVVPADMLQAFGIAVQGVTAASLTSAPVPPGTCATYLTAANLQPGSDILVVRRADTVPVPSGTVTTAGQLFLQADPYNAQIQAGGGTTSCTSDAVGNAAAVTRRCVAVVPASDTCATALCPTTAPAAELREMHVNIYFVAPCSMPANGGTTCTGAGDDSGTPIPTLKRLELSSSGAAVTFNIVPIAEGVEYMKIEYGIDNAPATANPTTGRAGDGVPDVYEASPTVADLANVVTVRVDLLVRNSQRSTGYSDQKVYTLGVNPVYSVGPMNDPYRRHVYGAETRLMNMAGRREIP